MTDVQFEEIIEKIEQLTRIVALSVINDKKRDDQLVLLSNAGFQPKDIASMVDTTPNAVRVRLSVLRKQKRRS